MLLALVLGAALAAGCGSDADTSSASGSKTSQATSIATAITQVGAHRAKLGTDDLNRSMLSLTMSVKGIGQTDISCYEAIAVPAFGSDFDSLSVFDLVVWLSDTDGRLPLAARESAQQCFSADSVTRLRAKQIAPDLDLAVARSVLPKSTLAEALSIGLTQAEATCYTGKIYNGLTDAEIKAGIAGSHGAGIPDPVKSIEACMTAKRRASLGPASARLVAKQSAADQAEHERTQASIDAELRAEAASSTTTPG
jgi:hypothetical protein